MRKQGRLPSRSDTNRPVQSQKQAISLKIWIEGGFYYLCSKFKNTSTADLHLCFCLNACCLLSYAVSVAQLRCVGTTTNFYKAMNKKRTLSQEYAVHVFSNSQSEHRL